MIITRKDLILCIPVMFFVVFCVTYSLASKKIQLKKFQEEKTTFYRRAIEINVQGAVRSPGVYFFTPGISIKNVIAAVDVKETADKKKLNLKAKLFSSCTIFVPEKEERRR